MNKRRQFLILILIILCLSVLILENTAIAMQPIVFKLGHAVSDEDPIGQGAKKFAELVKQKTNGEVVIEVYSNSQLGNIREMFEGMQVGTVDMEITGADLIGNFYPAMDLLMLPYLFENTEKAFSVIDGEIGQKLSEELVQKTGVRALASLNYGIRHIFTVEKYPVKTIEDLKGLKIRVPGAPVLVETFKAFGAAPTPVPWGEVYTAAQTGVINGFEQPASVVVKSQLYEIVKNMTLTGHVLTTAFILVAEKEFQSLTPDLQKLVKEAGQEAAIYQRKLSQEEDAEAIQFLKGKINVYEIDTEPLKKASRDLWYAREKQMGMEGLVDSILKLQGK